jgi:hypothetical protein
MPIPKIHMRPLLSPCPTRAPLFCKTPPSTSVSRPRVAWRHRLGGSRCGPAEHGACRVRTRGQGRLPPLLALMSAI